MNEELLQSRIDKIGSEGLRQLVSDCLSMVPPYFWMKPSSSTGKYHPMDEHLPGGLVLHTCRVVDVVSLLHDSHVFNVSKDEAIAACILHDIARFGLGEKPTEHSMGNHAAQAEWFFAQQFDSGTYFGVDTEVMNRIAQAIGRHMGRWKTPAPESPLDWLVHLADMVAAGYTPVKGDILR